MFAIAFVVPEIPPIGAVLLVAITIVAALAACFSAMRHVSENTQRTVAFFTCAFALAILVLVADNAFAIAWEYTGFCGIEWVAYFWC